MSFLTFDLPRLKRTVTSYLKFPDALHAFWFPVCDLAPGSVIPDVRDASFFTGFVPLCVALPEDAGDWPFLICLLHPGEARALDSGSVGLRTAATAAQAEGRNYLLPDFGADLLELIVVPSLPQDWVPFDVRVEAP